MRGKAFAVNRADLMEQAKNFGAKYYGLTCLYVELSDERLMTSGRFVADFTVEIHHEIRGKSYGPDYCQDCGKDSWPHDRLQQAAR